MSERIVHIIPNLQTKKYERKAVGIYARVSTAHSAQLHSISLQLSALVQRVYNSLSQTLNYISHIIEHQSQLRQGLEIVQWKKQIY